MSEEKKYDSTFIGWTEEPKFTDSGDLVSWTIKFKDHEVKDMLERFATKRNEEGKGGNVFVTLRRSKAGKSFATVYDPNSEKAVEDRKKAANNKGSDDLPF